MIGKSSKIAKSYTIGNMLRLPSTRSDIVDLESLLQNEGKMRIVQELVPGKQVTLAHVIANPDQILYKKLGLNPELDYHSAAIGILTISPSETAIIASDIAIKAAGVDLGFVDRFSGTVIITGTVSQVETALQAIVEYVEEKLGFCTCSITKT